MTTAGHTPSVNCAHQIERTGQGGEMCNNDYAGDCTVPCKSCVDGEGGRGGGIFVDASSSVTLNKAVSFKLSWANHGTDVYVEAGGTLKCPSIPASIVGATCGDQLADAAAKVSTWCWTN